MPNQSLDRLNPQNNIHTVIQLVMDLYVSAGRDLFLSPLSSSKQ